MIVIGISGKRGTGKTLLSDVYLKPRGFHIFSFADPLKEDVRRAYGLTKEHTNGNLKEVVSPKLGGRTPREAMIAEGEIRRRFSENGLYWVRKLWDEKIKPLQEHSWCVISDVRFKNEAAFVRQHGGYLIRLDRDPKLSIYKGVIDDPSETELDDYPFDLRLSPEKNITPQDLEAFSDLVMEFAKNAKSLV